MTTLLLCDICGNWFVSDEDNAHDWGELNICCEHCVWKVTHDVGEPQPKHTCKEELLIYLKKHLRRMPNNTFCEEICLVCNRPFDADLDYIYDLVGVTYNKTKFNHVRYVCYSCAEGIKKVNDKEKVVFS